MKIDSKQNDEQNDPFFFLSATSSVTHTYKQQQRLKGGELKHDIRSQKNEKRVFYSMKNWWWVLFAMKLFSAKNVHIVI